MSRLRPTRRVAALALALVGVAGLSLASASQLSINGTTLQAGSTVVSSCQPASAPVVVTFTTSYSSTAPAGFRATGVTFSGFDAACGGLALKARLLDTTGAALGAELVGTVPSAGGSLTLSVSSTAAESIRSVSAVVYG